MAHQSMKPNDLPEAPKTATFMSRARAAALHAKESWLHGGVWPLPEARVRTHEGHLGRVADTVARNPRDLGARGSEVGAHAAAPAAQSARMTERMLCCFVRELF